MQDIKVFENSEFGKVRVSVVDGEPYFVWPMSPNHLVI